MLPFDHLPTSPCRLPSGAEYLFSAKDDNELLSWVAVINAAIEKCEWVWLNESECGVASTTKPIHKDHPRDPKLVIFIQRCFTVVELMYVLDGSIVVT